MSKDSSAYQYKDMTVVAWIRGNEKSNSGSTTLLLPADKYSLYTLHGTATVFFSCLHKRGTWCRLLPTTLFLTIGVRAHSLIDIGILFVLSLYLGLRPELCYKSRELPIILGKLPICSTLCDAALHNCVDGIHLRKEVEGMGDKYAGFARGTV